MSSARTFPRLFWLPTAITLLGAFLSLCWLATGDRLAGAFGLLCDVLDGQIARRLGVASDFGAQLDWLTDCTIAALVLFKAASIHEVFFWGLLCLLPLQAYMHVRKIRFSGRAILMVGAMAVSL